MSHEIVTEVEGGLVWFFACCRQGISNEFIRTGVPKPSVIARLIGKK